MNRIKFISYFLGPLLFLMTYLLLSTYSGLSNDACKVLSVAAWMVCWWATEAVHISITALLPMVLLTAMGVIPFSAASAAYGHRVIFLFMGGFIIALALEKHNLHQRIALNLIRMTGTSSNGIIGGFVIATALISMWISNTATAIMMLPIALSVTDLVSNELVGTGVEPKKFKNFATGLMLCIAYTASVGGMATIIGTPPNVVTAGLYRQTYGRDITFIEWGQVALPVSLIICALCYLMITQVVFPARIKHIKGSGALIKGKLQRLGKISTTEMLVMSVFFVTAFCWIFRPMINQWLWGLIDHYSPSGNRAILDDTIIAMGGGILMFCIPTNLREGEFILSWKDMQKLPWGILILFGGGMCLAQSLEQVGLVERIGVMVSGQRNWPSWLLILMLTSIALFFTELMSNVALVNIFVPVVFGIADGFGYDPMLLAMPVTFAASCAFSLPVSTPPNAILYASGHIHLKDMLKVGILLNLLSIIVIVLASYLLE